MKKRDEIHEQEWKQMVHCYGNIYEGIARIDAELEMLSDRIHALQDDVFDVVIKETGTKKRGPYGPRKKKEIEHKGGNKAE